MVSVAAWPQNDHVIVTLKSAIVSARQSDDFLNTPNVIRDTGFHWGRHAERLMVVGQLVSGTPERLFLWEMAERPFEAFPPCPSVLNSAVDERPSSEFLLNIIVVHRFILRLCQDKRWLQRMDNKARNLKRNHGVAVINDCHLERQVRHLWFE